MNWGLGFKRAGTAFAVLYWAVTALVAYGAFQDGGRPYDSIYTPPDRYWYENRCYNLRTPIGFSEDGRRAVVRYHEANNVAPAQRRGQYLCTTINGHFWWGAAQERAREVLIPAAILWVVLWGFAAGIGWIVKGFRSRPPSQS